MAYELSEKKATEVITKIRSKIQDYFRLHNLTYAVFGKSEGLDSSVIAGLLSHLDGVHPIGVVIPIETDSHILPIARYVLDHFGIPRLEVDLTQSFRQIRDTFYADGSLVEQLRTVVSTYKDEIALGRIQQVEKLALGNIKVRLRMITLYHIAQLVGGLVVSTDNYSEYWMGFWTICGDIGDLCPIQQIFKGSELYTIGKVLGVPQESLNAEPSDGLHVTKDNTDEAQLGFPYAQLDRVILRLLNEGYGAKAQKEQADILSAISKQLNFSSDKVQSVADRLLATEFKRNWPVMFTREELGLPPFSDIED